MRTRRAVVVAVRGLLLAALAGALLHIPLPFPSSPVLQCVVLDVSGSLFWGRQTDAGDVAALLADDAARGSADDRYALVAFAGRPALLCPPSPPAAFLDFLRTELIPRLGRDAASGGLQGELRSDGTRIEDALDLALTLDDSGLPLRIVLLTDGGETAGSAIEAAGRLRRRGVPFAVVPVGPRDPPDVRIEAVHAPARVPPGAAFDVEAELSASVDTTVRVVVRRGGDIVASREIPVLRDTRARVSFPGIAPSADTDVLEVRVTPPPESDLCTDNNSLSVAVAQAPLGAKRVLYVGPPGPRAVEARLSRPDSPYALTRDPAAAASEAVDLVVLDDTPWEQVPPAVQSSLRHGVTHLGAGLLVLGGPHGLALGGYSGREAIEPLLPVWAAPDERLGLAVVLDCSGSMAEPADGGRPKIDAAREALRRVLPLLHPEDRLALLAFPTKTGPVHVLMPPQPPPPEAVFNTRLRSVEPFGGTLFEPALREASRGLAGAGTGLRHILMVTDGETNEPAEKLAAVGKALVDARVSLTLIVTGKNPAQSALDALGGRVATLADWKDLEALIEADVRRPKKLVAPGPIDVSPGAPSPLVEGLPAPPPLAAANRTTLRRDAAVVWQGPQGLPLLAVRQVGAGRTAVLATTLDDPAWGAAWRDWPESATLIDRLAAHLVEGAAAAVELRAEVVDEGIRVTAAWNEKKDPVPESLPPSLRVHAVRPDGTEDATELARVGAGRFEGTLPATLPGRYALRVEAPPADDRPGGAVGSVLTTVPYAAEWRRLGRQRAFLTRLADAGGGRVVESLARFRAERPAGSRLRDGFTPLVVAAIALLALDLAVATFWPERSAPK